MSIYSFEMQKDGKQPQSYRDEQLESNRLVSQLKEIGIDVFQYADTSNTDRDTNVRVHDVIQIYRIFNNLRDSGEDAIDEIKLNKLRTFPFFSDSEYEHLEQQAIDNLHQTNILSARKSPRLPPLSPFSRNITRDEPNATFERQQMNNSGFYPTCGPSVDTSVIDWVYEDSHRPSRRSSVKVYLKVNFHQFFEIM